MTNAKTTAQALHWAFLLVEQKQEAGVDRYGVEMLMQGILAVDELHLLQQMQTPLSEKQWAAFATAVKKYVAGTPVQYLLGDAAFFGRNFIVNDAVLIPRVETQDLVEWVLLREKNEALTVLDLATGSGAIGISLALERKKWQVAVSDISQDALSVCQKNQAKHHVNLPTYLSDVFDDIDAQFDVIVANPPYIAYDEQKVMDKSVVAHEPHLALFADHDGMAVYEKIATHLPQHLKPGGRLYLEFGYRQAEKIAALFEQQSYPTEVTLKNDLSNHPRMACITMC